MRGHRTSRDAGSGIPASCHNRRVLRQHHDPGADIDPAEQIDDVLIGQADATRRDEFPDRRGIVGAVNAVLAGAEIHRPRTERIAGTAGHEARQIGLARDHLVRRMPVRPFRLAADGLHPGPGKAVAPDADAVPDGPALAEHVIERGVAGIDDDGAGRLRRTEGDDGAAKPLGCRALVGRDHLIGGIGTRLGGGVAERLRARSAGQYGRQQDGADENECARYARRRAAIKGLCHGTAPLDVHHWMLCTNKRARGSAVPFGRRCGATLPGATKLTPPRSEPAVLRHVVVPVRIARSRLPIDRHLGRGKAIVSVIPTKPAPAKPSSAKPLASKSPPTKPLPGERQLPNGHEGTPVPDSRSEVPPVIRRTEVVAIALVGLLIICSIAGLYLAKAFFLPITMAFIVGTMLSPAASFLERCRIPGAV